MIISSCQLVLQVFRVRGESAFFEEGSKVDGASLYVANLLAGFRVDCNLKYLKCRKQETTAQISCMSIRSFWPPHDSEFDIYKVSLQIVH